MVSSKLYLIAALFFLSGMITGVSLTKHLLGVPIFGGKPNGALATVHFLEIRSRGASTMMVIDNPTGEPRAAAPSFCSDGSIWFARKDGSCWIADKPKF